MSADARQCCATLAARSCSGRLGVGLLILTGLPAHPLGLQRARPQLLGCAGKETLSTCCSRSVGALLGRGGCGAVTSRLGWLAQVFCLPRKPPLGLSGSGGLLRPESGARAMTLPGLTIWVGHRPALIPGEGKYTSPHHLDGKAVTSHGAWVQGSAAPWPSSPPPAGTQAASPHSPVGIRLFLF